MYTQSKNIQQRSKISSQVHAHLWSPRRVSSSRSPKENTAVIQAGHPQWRQNSYRAERREFCGRSETSSVSVRNSEEDLIGRGVLEVTLKYARSPQNGIIQSLKFWFWWYPNHETNWPAFSHWNPSALCTPAVGPQNRHVSHSLLQWLLLIHFLCAPVSPYFGVPQCECYCETVDRSEAPTMRFSLPVIQCSIWEGGER